MQNKHHDKDGRFQSVESTSRYHIKLKKQNFVNCSNVQSFIKALQKKTDLQFLCNLYIVSTLIFIMEEINFISIKVLNKENTKRRKTII